MFLHAILALATFLSCVAQQDNAESETFALNNIRNRLSMLNIDVMHTIDSYSGSSNVFVEKFHSGLIGNRPCHVSVYTEFLNSHKHSRISPIFETCTDVVARVQQTFFEIVNDDENENAKQAKQYLEYLCTYGLEPSGNFSLQEGRVYASNVLHVFKQFAQRLFWETLVTVNYENVEGGIAIVFYANLPFHTLDVCSFASGRNLKLCLKRLNASRRLFTEFYRAFGTDIDSVMKTLMFDLAVEDLLVAIHRVGAVETANGEKLYPVSGIQTHEGIFFTGNGIRTSFERAGLQYSVLFPSSIRRVTLKMPGCLFHLFAPLRRINEGHVLSARAWDNAYGDCFALHSSVYLSDGTQSYTVPLPFTYFKVNLVNISLSLLDLHGPFNAALFAQSIAGSKFENVVSQVANVALAQSNSKNAGLQYLTLLTRKYGFVIPQLSSLSIKQLLANFDRTVDVETILLLGKLHLQSLVNGSSSTDRYYVLSNGQPRLATYVSDERDVFNAISFLQEFFRSPYFKEENLYLFKELLELARQCQRVWKIATIEAMLLYFQAY